MVAGPKMRMPFDISYGSVIREVAILGMGCVCVSLGGLVMCVLFVCARLDKP
jgi:hypothetical protein